MVIGYGHQETSRLAANLRKIFVLLGKTKSDNLTNIVFIEKQMPSKMQYELLTERPISPQDT